MRTPKATGSGTYKKGTANNQWTIFMRELYGVKTNVNNTFVLEQLSDEERYENNVEFSVSHGVMITMFITLSDVLAPVARVVVIEAPTLMNGDNSDNGENADLTMFTTDDNEELSTAAQDLSAERASCIDDCTDAAGKGLNMEEAENLNKGQHNDHVPTEQGRPFGDDDDDDEEFGVLWV